MEENPGIFPQGRRFYSRDDCDVKLEFNAQLARWEVSFSSTNTDGGAPATAFNSVKEPMSGDEAHSTRKGVQFAERNTDKESPNYSPREPGPTSSKASPQEPEIPTPVHSATHGKLDEYINEMQRASEGVLPRLECKDGDTWVFIDAPHQADGQSDYLYSRIQDRFQHPIVSKKVFFEHLNSPYFNKLFGHDACFRTMRRRKLKQHELPAGIKYVLDLTPPEEGDEAVELLSALDLPRGVREWSEQGGRWFIDPTLIGGRDGYTDPMAGVPSYSPVRHRFAIEQFLTACAGEDPKLDSAAKVYSTVALSTYFQVDVNPLTDWVVRWLRAPPNNHILEVHPEIVLRMAESLRCESLCRDAFAILVGEQALEEACRARTLDVGKDQSMHRRKYGQDLLSEAFETRIQYARTVFRERTKRIFDDLASEDMAWLEGLPEFRNLISHTFEMENAHFYHIIANVATLLKAFVRGTIWMILCLEYHQLPRKIVAENNDLNPTSYRYPRYPNAKIEEIWEFLEPAQRIHTHSFWRALFNLGTKYALSPWPSSLTNYLPWVDNSLYIIAHSYKDLVPVMARASEDSLVEVKVLDLVSAVSTAHNMYLAMQSMGAGQPANPTLGTCNNYMRAGKSLFGPADGTEDLEKVTTGNGAPKTPATNFRPAYVEEDTKGDAKVGTEQDSPAAIAKKHDDEVQAKIFDVDTDTENPDAAQTATSSSSSQPTMSRCSQDLFNAQFFDIAKFFNEVGHHLHELAVVMRSPPAQSLSGSESVLQLSLSDHLVSLQDDELKFLPLWAGGLDDGTAGVFSPDVMAAEAGVGFTTSGPGIHCGSENNSRASSEYSMADGVASSAGQTSKAVEDGFSDTLERGRVVSVADSDDYGEVQARGDGASESSLADDATTVGNRVPGFVGLVGPLGILDAMERVRIQAEMDNQADREAQAKRELEEENYDEVWQQDSDEEAEFDDDDSMASEGSFEHLDGQEEDEEDEEVGSSEGEVVVEHEEDDEGQGMASE